MSGEQLRLWSVTSLIKQGLGTSDPLVNWAVRTTAEGAYDQQKILDAYREAGDRQGAVDWLTRLRYQSSGKAAARGTDLHKAAEQLALGQKPEVEDEVLPYVEQYRAFLDQHAPEFLMSEAPVYSPRYGYAGTCDGIMVLDGQRVVFDLKTTAHAPDSGRARPPFAEAAVQLCAYRRAELVGVLSEQRYAGGKRYYVFSPEAEHEPMPVTDGAVVIVVSPFDYQVVPARTDDTVWNAWLHIIEAARWQLFTSRNVFGPPLGAPARNEVAA
jgi:hypothetical protein